MIKKLIVVLMVMTAILCLSGCFTDVDYDFIQPSENIVKVELVIVIDTQEPIKKPLNEILPEFTVISELQDSEYVSFVDDLKNISFNRFYTDPGYMFSGEEAIKIIYANGDYELINDAAQATYQNKKYERTGYYCITRKDYSELKSRYFLE